MEKIMKYEEPELIVIHLTECDIITGSGENPDYETEIITY